MPDPPSGACRVSAVARPRPDARIGMELWLPPPARWSGRYYQMGNGGFAGSIHRPTLAEAARRGDAAAATDTGHVGTGFDASWAAGRPDLIEDYAHRSIKVTAEAARALTTLYYGRAPRRRYFMGCSNGGRQALMAASRYPGDWDGVIAGAPAATWTRQLESFAAIQHRRAVPGAWITPAQLPAILAAARRGAPISCRRGAARTCLSPGQAGTLALIERAGYPASRADADEWARWIVNPDTRADSQLTFANQAFRHLFRDDTAWSVARYDAVRDTPSPALRAQLDVGSLAAFRRRGGKILSYFGWADAVIAPAEGVRFYDRQAREAGGRARLRASYRLFMVPGMAHCQGGAAPHAFGQSLTAPSARDTPGHDVRRALEAWVERGVAPKRLVATGPGGTATLTPL